ncbi:MAG: universal stress protein [Bacteroidetes bacterium]|nr:MAG: universal stress protein [Bacteroidota bacterium]
MDTLKHILCPVDFSPSSYDAVEKASFLARLYQADLTMLHVISVVPKSFGVAYGLDMSSQTLVEDAHDKIRDLLREAKRKYVPFAVSCKSSIRTGRVSDEIIKEAREKDTDLIVMAAHGLSLSGSISEVIEGADCPVVAYQRLEGENHEQRLGFRKILVPVDHQAGRAGLVDLRKNMNLFLSRMSPEVVLLTVLPPDSTSEQEKFFKTALEDEGRAFIADGAYKVTIKVMEGKFPSEHINRLAILEGCDLIFMPVELPGRQGTQMDLTRHVVSAAKMPVFALRKKAPVA